MKCHLHPPPAGLVEHAKLSLRAEAAGLGEEGRRSRLPHHHPWASEGAVAVGAPEGGFHGLKSHGTPGENSSSDAWAAPFGGAGGAR